jgi:hypothetical protein
MRSSTPSSTACECSAPTQHAKEANNALSAACQPVGLTGEAPSLDLTRLTHRLSGTQGLVVTQQPGFACEATGVTAQRTVCADDAVAGNHKRNRIFLLAAPTARTYAPAVFGAEGSQVPPRFDPLYARNRTPRERAVSKVQTFSHRATNASSAGPSVAGCIAHKAPDVLGSLEVSVLVSGDHGAHAWLDM